MNRIDRYMEKLFLNIRGPEREIADLKYEIRRHLQDTVRELMEEGRTEDEAIRLALERFGDPRRFNGEFAGMFSSEGKRFGSGTAVLFRSVTAAAFVCAAAFAFAFFGGFMMDRGNGGMPVAARILSLESGARYHNESLLRLADIASRAGHNTETIFHIAELVREFKYHTVPLVRVASLAAGTGYECEYYREIAELIVMKLSETRRIEALAEAVSKATDADDLRRLEEQIRIMKAGADFKTYDQALAYNRRL